MGLYASVRNGRFDGSYILLTINNKNTGATHFKKFNCTTLPHYETDELERCHPYSYFLVLWKGTHAHGNHTFHR